MKKLLISITVAVLVTYLGYVLVAQVFPYINWIVNAKNIVTMQFDSPEELLAEESIDPAVRSWLKPPEFLSEHAEIASVDYEYDGLTTPMITLSYERNGQLYMRYKIGGNHELTIYKKLRTVQLDRTEGDLLVGRDNSVLIKWRDPSGAPYRYVYFFDESFKEDEMVDIAKRISAMHATT